MAPSRGRFLQSGCNRCWKTSVVINAFSKFVYDETCRVFHNTAALKVPGADCRFRGHSQSCALAVAGTAVAGVAVAGVRITPEVEDC